MIADSAGRMGIVLEAGSQGQSSSRPVKTATLSAAVGGKSAARQGRSRMVVPWLWVGKVYEKVACG